METIRKTVESKYAPKQTNVIWVDISGNTPVEKHFIKGKWIAVGGGGGTNVEANPTGEATTPLNKIKIGETNYNIPQTDTSNLVTKQELQQGLGGKQDTINDLSDIRSGAAAGETAYQKPSSGIPESDLSSDVQQALQKHFKGWYDSSSNLPANPVVGDYAYVKGAESTDPAAIYECTTAGTWSDSGRTADTSNVQTFASSEEVNETYIDDTHLANPTSTSVAKAIDVKEVKDDLKSLDVQINGGVDIIGMVDAKAIATSIIGRFSKSIGDAYSWLDNASQHSFKVDLGTLKSQGYSKLIITANSEGTAWYSLLKDTFPITESYHENIVSSNYMPMVSSTMGGLGYDTISANESKTIDITGGDIKYLVYAGEIIVSSVNYDKTPSVVSVVKEVIETPLVYDGLDSENPNKALSAKQGKILKDGIDELKVDVEGIDDTEILADGTNIWQTVIGRGFNTPNVYWDTSSGKTSKYIDLSTYKENGCNIVVVKGNSTKSGGYTLFNSNFNPAEVTGNITGSTFLNMLSTSMNGYGTKPIAANADVEIDVTNNDIKYITFIDYESRLPQSVKLVKRTVSAGLEERVEALEESIGNVPQLVIDTGRIISSLAENKRSDVRDKVRPLKILFIGNSFTWGVATDSFRNFTRLFTALGYEVVVGVSYQPSATVQYYDSIKNASTKVQYVKIKNTSFIITYESNYTNTTIEKVVDENWDVVFFIQGSASAGWYASYEPYFSNLLNWLPSKVLSLGCRVGWFMPWAWTTDRIQNVPSGSDTYKGNDGQPTTNIDNATMFQQICTATQSNIQAHPEIAIFAPCGTAVENQYINYPNSNVYLNDGQHLKNSPYSTINDCTDAGKFAAQLALFGVLAKYFYNIELADIVYNANFRVVEEVFNQAKISALNAITTPYEMTVIS